MLRLLAASVVVVSETAASAGDARGEWARENGASKVRIASCGDALCGSIIWLRDPSAAAKVGQQVFFDMKPHRDNVWTGSAFNPEDGKTYSGKMTLTDDHLVTAGCVFGGLICKSVGWTRAR
jgi:uncharacterized protein (DUF2147 family)